VRSTISGQYWHSVVNFCMGLQACQLGFERHDLQFPVIGSHAVRAVAVGLGRFPEPDPLGRQDGLEQPVVFGLARIAADGFPGMDALADADDEAGVGVGGAVAAGDEMVRLQDQVAVFGRAAGADVPASVRRFPSVLRYAV
jgi:hypothetical protein